MEYEATNFEAKHYVCGDVDVIEIKGEMSALAEGVYTEILIPLLRQGRRKFVLDVASMAFANSSGVLVFRTIGAAVGAYRGRVVFAALDPHYTSIFTVTRLSEAMPLFPTVSEAVAALHTWESGE